MAAIEIELLDRTRCASTHTDSGSRVETDIGLAYGGGGTAFSSTDLVALALGTCIGSSIAPMLLREGIPLEKAGISVEKELGTNPKRISRLKVDVSLPQTLSETQVRKLSNAAHTCTVHRSLSSAIDIEISIPAGRGH